MIEFQQRMSSEDHAVHIQNINAALSVHTQRRGELPSHRERADQLRRGIREKQSLLQHPAVQETLTAIADKVLTVRKLFAQSPEDILPHTLAVAKDFLFVSDRDGSMTYINQSEKEYLLPHGPGSVPLEAHIDVHGRGSLPDAFVRNIQPLLRRHPEIFHEAGRHAGKLRDGVVELFGWLKKRGTPRVILSANWGELVRGGLADTPLAQDKELQIQAVEHNDLTSTDKSTALQLLAAEHPSNVIVYVGDGASDLNVEEAYNKGLIGWIFALQGSPFDKALTAKGILHSTYNNYHEIQLELEHADIKAQKLRQKAA